MFPPPPPPPPAAAATWLIGDWFNTMTCVSFFFFFTRTIGADGIKTRVASHPHSWSHTWETDNTITGMEAGGGWHGATTRKSNDESAEPDFKKEKKKRKQTQENQNRG